MVVRWWKEHGTPTSAELAVLDGQLQVLAYHGLGAIFVTGSARGTTHAPRLAIVGQKYWPGMKLPGLLNLEYWTNIPSRAAVHVLHGTYSGNQPTLVLEMETLLKNTLAWTSTANHATLLARLSTLPSGINYVLYPGSRNMAPPTNTADLQTARALLNDVMLPAVGGSAIYARYGPSFERVWRSPPWNALHDADVPRVQDPMDAIYVKNENTAEPYKTRFWGDHELDQALSLVDYENVYFWGGWTRDVELIPAMSPIIQQFLLTNVPETPDDLYYGPPPPAPSGYRLHRSPADGIPDRNSPHSMTVTVTASDNLDPNVFVFLRLLSEPLQPTEPRYRFDHIAAPADLEEVPVGRSLSDVPARFYRTNAATFRVRSTAELDRIWSTLRTEMALLSRSLQDIQLLVSEEDSVVVL